ncbi:cysteine desulfurase [Lachnotalea glycerini]|uniref:cysteine desulfurase n=1 Tax=Lachnotalea glycerini TaxID=1763509 RepID=A0A318EQK9_9FIRM|nr:cysteine desulfurase family protein [Lachnotalea glycerini]PXV93751.1 cysteine desulfurase [Lachnotalea glycerini]
MIYADNAATTKISDVAFENMLPFLREEYGNASSQYSLGTKARRAIVRSRQQVAVAIGADPSEITFTSGGSEANSWVLRSIAEAYCSEAVHIITSSIEHHSVLNACHVLEQNGVEVTYLPVDSNGCVSVNDVKLAIKPTTKLVSIMFANNEIGTIQPIEEIGKLLNEKGILFHTDAVQTVGHIPIDVHGLQIDFLTASAHKFNGAKGTGILYKRSGLKLPPLVFGGEQEQGLRAGTENVAGIVALGCALEESVANITEMSEMLSDLVQITIKRLKEAIPEICINGEDTKRLPGILSVTFPYASGEAIMHLLDMKGICVSTSSACNSGKDTPSHVLLALGLTEQQAKSTIRISYGRYNTIDEAEKIIEAISSVYSKIVANI